MVAEIHAVRDESVSGQGCEIASLNMFAMWFSKTLLITGRRDSWSVDACLSLPFGIGTTILAFHSCGGQ